MNAIAVSELESFGKFIETWGCITINRVMSRFAKSPAYTAMFTFCTVDRELAEYLQKITGLGTIQVRERKPAYFGPVCFWIVGGPQVGEILKTAYPYLNRKKAQADIIFELLNLPKGIGGRSGRVPEETTAKREALRLKIQSLHSRKARPVFAELAPKTTQDTYSLCADNKNA